MECLTTCQSFKEYLETRKSSHEKESQGSLSSFEKDVKWTKRGLDQSSMCIQHKRLIVYKRQSDLKMAWIDCIVQNENMNNENICILVFLV